MVEHSVTGSNYCPDAYLIMLIVNNNVYTKKKVYWTENVQVYLFKHKMLHISYFVT